MLLQAFTPTGGGNLSAMPTGSMIALCLSCDDAAAVCLQSVMGSGQAQAKHSASQKHHVPHLNSDTAVCCLSWLMRRLRLNTIPPQLSTSTVVLLCSLSWLVGRLTHHSFPPHLWCCCCSLSWPVGGRRLTSSPCRCPSCGSPCRTSAG